MTASTSVLVYWTENEYGRTGGTSPAQLDWPPGIPLPEVDDYVRAGDPSPMGRGMVRVLSRTWEFLHYSATGPVVALRLDCEWV